MNRIYRARADRFTLLAVALALSTLAPAAAGASGQSLNVLPLVNALVGASAPAVTVIANHRFFAKGSGFQPGETVRLTVTFALYDGTYLPETKTAPIHADGTSAGVLMTVPNGAKQGFPFLDARGLTSARKAKATIHVVYRPSLHVTVPSLRPGQAAIITGSGFVPGSRDRVSIIIPRPGQPTETLSQDVKADGSGAFTTSIALPSNTRTGVFTVMAVDVVRGFQGQTSLTISVNPSITSVRPDPVLPGNGVTITGGGFAANSQITLHATFPLYTGGPRTVTASAQTNGKGNFSARLYVPGKAASGSVRVVAAGASAQTATSIHVRQVAARISVSPGSVIPGQSVTILGSGYPAGDAVAITMSVTLMNGSKRTLHTTATATSQGSFSVTLPIPADISGGTFTLIATSGLSGRAPTAQVTIARLAPSVVALPTTAVPGTQIAVHGFGFAANESVRIYLIGRRLGSVTTDGNGRFALKVTIPSDVATGTYALSASAVNGQKANISLAVIRHVSTHFYFPSEYTGARYSNYLTFSNLTAIRARVTITYQLKDGSTRTRSITTNPHTRYTDNVNADLGANVSASAEVSADVPIAAEGVVYKGSGGAVVPGSPSPSTIWYFANGNTTHHYSEFVAVQNPNPGPVQIAVHFLPTHHKAFTIYRNMAPTSRTTIKVSTYVKDAVGVIITSNGPVVANRSIFIKHGVMSKNGVTAPMRTWYFAAGPQNNASRHWIAAINPSAQGASVTVQTYGPFGNMVGTKSTYLKPNARIGYLINGIAHRSDAAVVLTASAPIVAEQTTYVGSMHDASTDTFGVTNPARSWSWAVVNTSTARGEGDGLDLFNPNPMPVPIVVQFINSSGGVLERTYVVYPLYHQHIDVGSVEPTAQLAIVAASNYPFVPINRYVFNFGLGADTSTGIPG
jgi:hypothetical protein